MFGIVTLAVLSGLSGPAQGASNQLQPMLKAIDPSLAKMDTFKPETPQAAPSPNPLGTVNGAPLDDDDSSRAPTRINRFPASGGQDDSGGGFTPAGGAPPSESMIPSFDKPLPVSPSGGGNDGSNNGQLWGTNQYAPPQGQPAQNQAAEAQAASRLTRLEQLVFGSTYPDHEFGARLDHVEKEVLGSTSDGQPIDRIGRLEGKVGGQGIFSSPPTVATAAPPPRPPRQFSPTLPSGQGGISGGGPSNGGFVPNPAANAPDGGSSGGFVPNPAANGNSGGFAPNPAANQPMQPLQPMPMQPPAQVAISQPPSTNSSVIGGADATRIIQAMPNNPKAGDYFSALKPIRSGQYARWSRFPVLVHLPQDCPDAWRRVLKQGVDKWNGLIPLIVATPYQTADIEMVWINHLPQTLLGITRLIVVNGQMHIQIFMLRPTFYNSDVPERALGQVFLHELGHALGLFCHSESAQDVMYPCDGSQAKGFSKNPTISARDTNTLKRLYQSLALDSDLTLSAPIEWGYSGD